MAAALRGGLDEAGFDAAVAEANGAFHGAIHRAARNGRLLATIRDLQHFFPRDSVWRAIADDPARLHAMNISSTSGSPRRCARAGRPARRAMREHVGGAGRDPPRLPRRAAVLGMSHARRTAHRPPLTGHAEDPASP